MTRIESATWKRYERARKLRRNAENRDVYYYYTDLVRNGGNHKKGDVYNQKVCFASVFWERGI